MREGDTVVPTFPNARYIVAEPALQVWRDHDADATAAHGSTAAMEVPLAAGLVDVVATDHRLTDDVRLMSTPGHTTGQVPLMIESVGARALVTGDLTHHPVQWAEPSWGQATDHDVAESTRTRKSVLDEYGDTDVVLIGSHYAGGGRFLPLL